VPYRVITIACDYGDPWGGTLHAELERGEAEGFYLCAMTTRVAVAVAPVGTPTRYVQQLVLVLHKEMAA
jgi:hypothetical protein